MEKNEADFLGSRITWIHSDISSWRIAARPSLTAQVHETNCSEDLHNTVVALECVERQTAAIRRFLKLDSDLWVRMVRHQKSDVGEILAQVSFVGGDPWPFAVVTTTEHGHAQSHLSVAIPYANRAAAGTDFPQEARCFLDTDRIIAIARCAMRSKNYRPGGHSLGFTLALDSGRMDAPYPDVTYDLHRLLIREMLGWAYRRNQYLKEKAAA